VLREGSNTARAVAADTLLNVKRAMKIDYFSNEELVREQAVKYKLL